MIGWQLHKAEPRATGMGMVHRYQYNPAVYPYASESQLEGWKFQRDNGSTWIVCLIHREAVGRNRAYGARNPHRNFTSEKDRRSDKQNGGGLMARYPKKATYRTFVIDSKTGEWKQIDPKDIPQNKIDELCDKFALGAGYKRVE